MNEIEQKYSNLYHSKLVPCAKKLQDFISCSVNGMKRIERVVVRAKSIDSFLRKSENVTDEGCVKYSNPFIQIQDQIGARIIVYYLSDVEEVAKHVKKYFTSIEIKNLSPERGWEFGYFGKHFIFKIPTDVLGAGDTSSGVPEFFELQIKTLFQHAWSEANHDIGYKGATSGDVDVQRRLAFTSAQAWGADHIFDELLKKCMKELTAPQVDGEKCEG